MTTPTTTECVTNMCLEPSPTSDPNVTTTTICATNSCLEPSPTTVVVAVDVTRPRRIPSDPTFNTTTTAADNTVCVQNANGNWNWGGEMTPCTPPATTAVASHQLPSTGSTSAPLVGVSSFALLVGVLMALLARRKATT